MALGQCPVAVVRAVGEPGHEREQRVVRITDAVDRDRVQRIGGPIGPLRRGGCDQPLGLAPQLFHYDEWARTVAAVAENTCQARGTVGTCGVDDGPTSGLEHAGDHVSRVRDGADQLDLGGGPADPRADEREGRGMADYGESAIGQAAGQRGADPVEHRIATGQHTDGPLLAGHEVVDQRSDRARPRSGWGRSGRQ